MRLAWSYYLGEQRTDNGIIKLGLGIKFKAIRKISGLRRLHEANSRQYY